MSFRKNLFATLPTRLYPKEQNKPAAHPGLAVVIHTCDKYHFLWEGWNHFFQKHWAFNEHQRVYFLNEERPVQFKNVTHLPTGKGEWSDRLAAGLKSIPEEHVFYLQEDFWPVRHFNIDPYYRVFLRHSMNALRVTNDCNYYYLKRKRTVSHLHLREFSKRSKYLISHQASIWQKQFFLSCLGENETPWQNEEQGTLRLQARKESLKIYLSEHAWYTGTCRGGALTDEGKQMLREAGLPY